MMSSGEHMVYEYGSNNDVNDEIHKKADTSYKEALAYLEKQDFDKAVQKFNDTINFYKRIVFKEKADIKKYFSCWKYILDIKKKHERGFTDKLTVFEKIIQDLLGRYDDEYYYSKVINMFMDDIILSLQDESIKYNKSYYENIIKLYALMDNWGSEFEVFDSILNLFHRTYDSDDEKIKAIAISIAPSVITFLSSFWSGASIEKQEEEILFIIDIFEKQVQKDEKYHSYCAYAYYQLADVLAWNESWLDLDGLEKNNKVLADKVKDHIQKIIGYYEKAEQSLSEAMEAGQKDLLLLTKILEKIIRYSRAIKKIENCEKIYNKYSKVIDDNFEEILEEISKDINLLNKLSLVSLYYETACLYDGLNEHEKSDKLSGRSISVILSCIPADNEAYSHYLSKIYSLRNIGINKYTSPLKDIIEFGSSFFSTRISFSAHIRTLNPTPVIDKCNSDKGYRELTVLCDSVKKSENVEAVKELFSLLRCIKNAIEQPSSKLVNKKYYGQPLAEMLSTSKKQDFDRRFNEIKKLYDEKMKLYWQIISKPDWPVQLIDRVTRLEQTVSGQETQLQEQEKTIEELKQMLEKLKHAQNISLKKRKIEEGNSGGAELLSVVTKHTSSPINNNVDSEEKSRSSNLNNTCLRING